MQCSYTHPPFRAALSGLGLKTMLEIGSLHGLDAIEVLKTYGLERVITIECNPECIEICRRNFAPYPNITLVEVAAWHEDGRIPFYRVTESQDWKGAPTHNIGASSCFQTNDTWPFEKYTQEKIEVPARRLEGVLRELEIDRVDLICMDAQGAELHALKGLGPFLDGVQAIITELELKPMYHGQSLFHEVQQYLLRFGFRLRAENRWAQTAGDFLFVRESADAGEVHGRHAGNSPATRIVPAPPEVFTPDDAALACKAARRQFDAGRSQAAEAIINTVLAKCGPSFGPYVLRGQMAEQRRDFDTAIAAYEKAAELNPGHALPFTRRALLKFRLAMGNPPPARSLVQNRPFVMMNTLGINGRFGNQLLQYGVMRRLAAETGAELSVGDWIGRDLFGLDDPVPGGLRPAATINEQDVVDALARRRAPTPANVNVTGYFCGAVADWAVAKPDFQRAFEPVVPVRRHGDAALERVAGQGRTLVALHIRHGDYGSGRFWIAPVAWYHDWLRRVWAGLVQPVLYLATDDPAVAAEFREYGAITAADLGPALPGVEFFTDHWILRHADLIGISNSTFSYTAALLNRRGGQFVRPDRAVGGLRPFDPWREKVLLD